MNTFQQRRDEVIGRFINGGEPSARAYIKSLADPDERDVARAHFAQFLINKSLISNDTVQTAFAIVAEIEDHTEKLDVLLAISRILSGHHRLKEAREVLRDVESLSEQSSERAGYLFLIAIELKHLELQRDAIQMLKRAVTLSSEIHDDSAVANTALWLARWGAKDEAETVINNLSMPSIRENTVKCLNEIWMFKNATSD